jgi:hypothetical protein
MKNRSSVVLGCLVEQAQKHSNGSYINEFNQEGRPEDIPLCFSPKSWAKLAELRRRWDPGAVFHTFYGQDA